MIIPKAGQQSIDYTKLEIRYFNVGQTVSQLEFPVSLENILYYFFGWVIGFSKTIQEINRGGLRLNNALGSSPFPSLVPLVFIGV